MYGKSRGWELDNLKFRIDLVEGLSVKYSVQCAVSDHCVGDNTVRLTEQHFPTRISPQRRNINQQDMTEEEILYIIVRLDCDIAVCVDRFSRAYSTGSNFRRCVREWDFSLTHQIPNRQ
jgi:hypothetical protein